MAEVSTLEFVQDVTNVDRTVDEQEYLLKHGKTNKETRIILQEIDRKELLDQLGKLPREMLEILGQIDEGDDPEEQVDEIETLSAMDGNTVDAFEQICAQGMNDPDGEATSHHFAELAPDLSFEVLFDMGSRIINMSMDESDKITDFRKVDSDKNS